MLTDMAKSPEEIKDDMSPMAVEPDRYPYGLRITLTHDELDKLNVDYSDWSVGAVFHLHALAKVVSISSNETENGENCCVQLQITHISGPESEDEEDEQEEMDERVNEPDLSKNGYYRS